ncbi:DUF4446 family protein [Candidatus Parcubacteria bacterium]|nr:MAG: DUF4446 family protein [Candidatus Parcubacteria bacterium]
MNLTPELLLIVIYFFWFLILTILFLRLYFYYLRVVKNNKKESLVKLIDDVLKKEKDNEKSIKDIYKTCDTIKKDARLHIQKIGLLRFNPFKDTGGDQSFILALVDAEDTGVVVSSLHTRVGTRWYAKKIIKGKSSEYALSDEEHKAIREAKLLHETA